MRGDLRAIRIWALDSLWLFFEYHIDTYHGCQDQLTDWIITGHRFGNFKDIVVRTGEEFPANPRPFLRHMGQFSLTFHELEIPSRPLALELANRSLASIQDGKSTTYRKEFLLEPTDTLTVSVNNIYFGKKDGDSSSNTTTVRLRDSQNPLRYFVSISCSLKWV